MTLPWELSTKSGTAGEFLLMPFLDTQLAGSSYRGEPRVPSSQMSCESQCIEGCDPKEHLLTCRPAASYDLCPPRQRCCRLGPRSN